MVGLHRAKEDQWSDRGAAGMNPPLRGPKPKPRDLHPLVYKFRELRRARNVSAKELGAERYIHRMETGDGSPGLYRFVELLNALGFDLAIVEKPSANPSA